ncbi:hypothetical protein EYW49_08745 [Siculibacillus lacustris]|uniref:Polysaccharide chain length determinant N-terminal domain-containing protein n=1 Tax=Siculibacillus lacustris TaxID=1549641 RepID=A0A4Q9VT82_9HYPH|nr:GumC family protein [Siculibacillus lacustris]TBW38769.1 hypothetical protein EYW49_08745 [Siculibacillus lacustris]
MASAGSGLDWEEPGGRAAAPVVRLPGLIDLTGVAAALAARWPSILIATILGAAVAVGVWTVWPAKYTATALIMIDPRTARATSTDEVLPGIGGDGMAIASLAEIATSDGVLIPLIESAKLAAMPDLAGASSASADVAATLRRGLKVARRGLTYVIEVSMTARSAAGAAQIANLVATDIVRRQSATRIEASTGVSGALGARLADLRAAALASERAVADYRQAHGLLDAGADASVGQRRLSALTQQATALRGRLEEARARFEELKRARSQDVGGSASPRSDLLSGLRAQFAEETRQSAEATRVFGPRHPRVEAAQQRLATLSGQIRAETDRLVEQARTELDTLSKQTAAAELELTTRTRDELALDQDEVGLRDLIRRAQSDRQIYEQFLTRQKATQEQPALTRPDTEIVSPALPPAKSDKPSPIVVAVVGAMIGLLAGGVRAVGRGPKAPVPARFAPLGVLRRVRVADLVHHEEAPALSVAAAAIPVAAPSVTPVAIAPPAVVAPSAVVPPPAVVATPQIPAAAEAPIVLPVPAPSEPIAPAPAAPAEIPIAPAAVVARPSPAIVVPPPVPSRLDAATIFATLGLPVVADVPTLVGSAEDATDIDVDLDVVDARGAIAGFAATFLAHLPTDAGTALIVTAATGAIGRTTLALAIARAAEAAGLATLIVTDHDGDGALDPSLRDLLDGAADLDRDPPAETYDRVSVAAFDGRPAGFWSVAADPGFPELIADLCRMWDLVVLDCPAPATLAQSLSVAAVDAVPAVLVIADPARTSPEALSAATQVWRRDDRRLVMVALNRPGGD